MAHHVDYPTFPGARPADWVERLVQVLVFIRDFSPTAKAFREWAATMGWWDKAEMQKLFALFGVTLGPDDKYVVDAWGLALVSLATLEQQKEEVFKLLLGSNELLVKFVFLQLKERVHGTEPLYRQVSGFSYRGVRPTLPSFTAWMGWVSGCGFVRKLGVAWALAAKADSIFKVIEAIDEDEVVAEMEAAQKEAAGAAAAGAAAPAAAASGAAAGDEEEEEASARVGAAPAGGAREAESAPAGAPREARVAVARILSPVRFRAVEHPPLEVDDAELARTLGRLMELWRGRPAGRLPGVPRAAEAGLSAAEYKGAKKPFLVFRVACLGAIHYRARLAPEASLAAYQGLDRAGVFKALFADGASLDGVLAERGWFVQEELERAASRALLDVLPLRTALRDHGAKAIKELEGAADGDALLEALAGLCGNALDLELFYVARELHDLGAWGAAAAELAVVPDRPTRDQAFRLGFIDSPYAHDLGDLREGTRRLARWFGKGEAFGLPLLALERAWGCAYRCLRADSCDLTCRERFELGRK